MSSSKGKSRETGGVEGRRWWRAVLARDARFDRAFVYGVRSRGVYCVASCPARRPRRQQVVFFATPEAAERAGMRACRRCQPKAGGTGGRDAKLVREVCRQIDATIGRSAGTAGLAEL